MASYESMNMIDTDHDSTDDGYLRNYGLYEYHPHSHIQSYSRLSMCTNSVHEDDDDDDDDGMRMFMSMLSIESFDADEEISDFHDEVSDSDTEEGSCYSLLATRFPRKPPRRCVKGGLKEYASENEGQRGVKRQNMRKGRIANEKLEKRDDIDDQENLVSLGNFNSFTGESESGGGGSGLMVITRPKGGRRSLCMDLEEVKACRELGFELEHQRMLEIPGALVSVSGSNLDTNSSGADSPIASWRIPSPGADQKEVKARLKAWAQTVVFASAYRQGDP